MAERNDRSGLAQAASAAHSVHGAAKTGKSIAAAAKGAAAGGPFGAAAGLALTTGHHAKKVIIVLAGLLMLPALFILMLPAIIFGGLFGSGSSGRPVMNDNAAIRTHMNEIAAAIDEMLADGVADTKQRIADDFATTGGDNYEIIEPSSVSGNTNIFIAQYCAAKEQEWAEISLNDMRSILRSGESQFYSFTRTSEIREVEADNPDTEDVDETRNETWYIYTILYNGEDYFADHVFHLSDEQKQRARDYADNLSVFLDDGLN